MAEARRRALFALVPVTLLLLALGATELVMRGLWGPPAPDDLWIRVHQCGLGPAPGGTALRCPGDPPSTVEIPAKSGPRVVLLGGSSVRIPTGGIDLGPHLARALGGAAEVVSLGVPGLSVAGLIGISEGLEPVAPDVVVVYSGHNDYAADVFQGGLQRSSPGALAVSALVRRSHLLGLLTRPPGGAPPPMRTARYVNPVESQQARTLRPALDARYQSDLRTLVDALQDIGAHVILATLLRAPHWPPSGEDTTGHPDCAAAIPQLVGPGPVTAATVDRAARLCGEGALHAWLVSRRAWAQGDRAGAQAAFDRSLDEDRLPLRAPPSADRILREVAAQTGATIVDMADQHGVAAPPGWFTDPIHLTPRGHQAMAEQLAPAVAAALPPR